VLRPQLARAFGKVNLWNDFRGVYAALLSPRDKNGELDFASYQNQLAHLSSAPLTGYAINGATGEFNLASDEDLEALTRATRRVAPTAQILLGIGAADSRLTICRARIAQAAGADALLLPMPCFFPYRQDDLAAYISSVASAVELPILLYNLPQFTSGLTADTVLALFARHRIIVGIKDSSGSLEIVRAMTDAGLPHARLIGNDGALCDALTENVCDGVVSGVACTLPERMSTLFATAGAGESFTRKRVLLDQSIEQLGALPTPWGSRSPAPSAGSRKKAILSHSLQNAQPKPHRSARGLATGTSKPCCSRNLQTVYSLAIPPANIRNRKARVKAHTWSRALESKPRMLHCPSRRTTTRPYPSL
jgi:4-hydroxy-tetrahydrodipicolinate synthase